MARLSTRLEAELTRARNNLDRMRERHEESRARQEREEAQAQEKVAFLEQSLSRQRAFEGKEEPALASQAVEDLQ